MSGTRIVNVAGVSANAIEIVDVVKSFKKNTIRREYTTFKSELLKWLRRKKDKGSEARMIEALRGITLEIPRGKTVGILGRNGSGKSTLLKLVTGIYTPTAGSITVNGRISALLDLGAGFHPDFSGRENIVINGIILGMTRAEVRARMDEIIAFSELGDFIDEPVRTYSSGMFMRLAFAVATHVDPEILIIDEILAVGDAHFGKKSRAKMNEFKQAGKTILLVTHDLPTVEAWCDLAAWIDGGRIRRVGPPKEVVAEYVRAVALAEEQAASFTPPALSSDGGGLPAVPPPAPISDPVSEKIVEVAPPPPAPVVPVVAVPAAPRPRTGPPADDQARSGNFDVEISYVRFLDAAKAPRDSFDADEPVELQLQYTCHRATRDVVFGACIRLHTGELLHETTTWVDKLTLSLEAGKTGALSVRFDRIGLNAGEYLVDVYAKQKGGPLLDHQLGLYRVRVTSECKDNGLVLIPRQWDLDSESAASPGVGRTGTDR